MARMSKEKRIELGTAFLDRWLPYEELASDRRVLFVTDMIARLKAGRGMSKNQRAWYDDLVLEDPPQPSIDGELLDRMLRAMHFEGIEDRYRATMADFVRRVKQGYTLTDKQMNYVHKLLAKCEDIEKNGRWAPDDEMVEEIKIGVAFARRYDDFFNLTHPGTHRAIGECKEYLEGRRSWVGEWSARKVASLCQGDRKKMHKLAERWPSGKLVNVIVGKDEIRPGLVIESPVVNDNGRPAVKVLVDGEMQDIPTGNLRVLKK